MRWTSDAVAATDLAAHAAWHVIQGFLSGLPQLDAKIGSEKEFNLWTESYGELLTNLGVGKRRANVDRWSLWPGLLQPLLQAEPDDQERQRARLPAQFRQPGDWQWHH